MAEEQKHCNMSTYRAAFKSGLSTLLEYRMDFFSNSVLSLIVNASVQVMLWSAVYAGRDNISIGTYSSEIMITYLLYASVYTMLTRSGRVERNASDEIRNGDLNKYLIKPISHLGFSGALAAADRFGVFLFSILAIPFIPLITSTPFNGWAIFWSLLILLMAITIKFMISMSIAYLAFWYDETWTFHVIIDISMTLLSGSILPIDILPTWLQTASHYLPFMYLSYVPAAISSGTIPLSDAPHLCALSIAWCCITGFIAWSIWKLGIRKFGAYGG